MIGPVDFVHKQHSALGILQNLQQRTRNQETIVVNVDLALAGLADGEKLALIVPFVERMSGVDALVALQPDEIARQQLCDGLGGFRLADARRAFEQQRLAEPDGEEDRGGEAIVGEVAHRGEARGQRLGDVAG